MKTEFAKTFNEIAALYDTARIGYPPQIYDVIDIHSHINTDSRILEIGCGSGIATQEIFRKWKSNIIAIDPGSDLLEIARQKSLHNKKIQYEHCNFDEYSGKEKFDAIFSATAFHWLEKRTKYKKSSEMLNKNGQLILFWNNYVIDEEEVDSEIQKIYGEFHPDGALKDARLHYKNKIRNRKNEINNSIYFDLSVHHEYTYSINMDSQQYVNLLKSFSNNSSIKSEEMQLFYKEIEAYINSHGKKIKLTIVVNLEIANKK